MIQKDVLNDNYRQEPYAELAKAVVLQAVRDYMIALRDDDRSEKSSLERFFRSDWYLMLTEIDSEAIIKNLRENVPKFCKLSNKRMDEGFISKKDKYGWYTEEGTEAFFCPICRHPVYMKRFIRKNRGKKTYTDYYRASCFNCGMYYTRERKGKLDESNKPVIQNNNK